MNPNPKASNHKPECLCVACRLTRGEKPNPGQKPGGGNGARSRSYLWLTRAADEEVTRAALALGRSKASIAREALLTWLQAWNEGSSNGGQKKVSDEKEFQQHQEKTQTTGAETLELGALFEEV